MDYLKKKFLIFMLTAIVTLLSTISIHAATETNHKGILNGYEDGSIRLQSTATRAEVAQMLYNLGIFSTEKHNYLDVDTSSWYYTAFNETSFLGYGNGYVKPNNTITRAEMVSLLVRILPKDNVQVANTKYTSFSDVDASSWYYNDIMTASNLGYLQGYPDGSFKPNQEITRVEAVTLLKKFLNI